MLPPNKPITTYRPGEAIFGKMIKPASMRALSKMLACHMVSTKILHKPRYPNSTRIGHELCWFGQTRAARSIVLRKLWMVSSDKPNPTLCRYQCRFAVSSRACGIRRGQPEASADLAIGSCRPWIGAEDDVVPRSLLVSLSMPTPLESALRNALLSNDRMAGTAVVHAGGWA